MAMPEKNDQHRAQRAVPSGRGPLKTQVCITIDTEFSIGGAFAHPSRYRPLGTALVECRAEGRSEGLGFLLRLFARYGVQATFFVEVLQRFYFGDRLMGGIAERIAGERHDVQLHLHPCWLHFRHQNWRSVHPSDDSCAGRSVDELAEMIGFGFDAFARWGLPRPTALRTGGFCTDPTIYSAMARTGLALGSNVGLGVYRPQERALQVASGRYLIENVLEVPALTYCVPGPVFRNQQRVLGITSTSAAEMRTLLWQAREADLSPVVILTHPFEYVKTRDYRWSGLRRNRINQQRLEDLLIFLGQNRGDFECATFGRNGADWLAAGPTTGPLLSVPWSLACRRAAANLANDRLWAY